MEKDLASQMFPVWASKEAVKIVDEPLPKQELPFKHRISEKQNRFMKRYAFAIVFIAVLAIYSVLICLVTGMVVRRNTLTEMEAQYRAQMQAYLDQQEQERMAAGLVTGEESRQAGMDLEAREIAKVLYGVRTNNQTDLRTLVWCVLNRVDNKSYPNTVAEVVAQDRQWMGYSVDNPVLDDLFNIAYGELEIWYGGIRPCSPDFVFMNWTPSEITLRDTFEFSSKTHSWSVGK